MNQTSLYSHASLIWLLTLIRRLVELTGKNTTLLLILLLILILIVKGLTLTRQPSIRQASILAARIPGLLSDTRVPLTLTLRLLGWHVSTDLVLLTTLLDLDSSKLADS